MTYRVGLSGLGNAGTRHVAAYGATDGVSLVAVADIDPAARRQFTPRGSSDPRQYEHHEAMLEAEDLDVVSVATPSGTHRDHVLAAVGADGGPGAIWCEKPIAVSVTGAREMVEVCDDAGVDLVVNHTRRFSTTYRSIREAIVKERVLGDVQSVQVQWPAELLRNGTHAVDLATFLLDDRIESVSGWMVDDADDTWVDRPGGGTAVTEGGTHVTVDCTTSREAATRQWLLVGDSGSLRFSEATGEVAFRRLERTETGSYGTEHVPGTLPDPVEAFDPGEELFAAAAAHVRDVLDGEATNRSPGGVATHVLAAIVGMVVSHDTGARVDCPLPPTLRGVRVTSY